MKKLKDVKPGEFMYSIFIHYNRLTHRLTLTVAQRKVIEVEQVQRYHEINVRLKRIINGSVYFGTIVNFSKFEEDQDCVKSGCSTESELIYCFSQKAFIRELKNVLKETKKTMVYNKLFITTHRYYNEFMPAFIKMVNSNKNGYAQITY